MFKLTSNLFEYFMVKVVDAKYKFTTSTTIQKSFDSFFDECDKNQLTFGINSFWLYFQWFFSRWDFIEHQPKMNQLISKASLQKWLKRNKDFDWVDYDIEQKYLISQKEFISLFPQQNETVHNIIDPLSIVEEAKRKLYLNTEKGFSICLTDTSLYHPKSPTCLLCHSRQKCKNILITKYQNLAKTRLI